MGEFIRKLWTDSAFFASTLESLKGPLKGLMLTLGAMLSTGQIDLGPKMWWIAPFLMGGSSLIQKTNKDVPPSSAALLSAVNAMEPMQKADLKQNLAPVPVVPESPVAVAPKV